MNNLTQEQKDARRYQWLKENMKEELTPESLKGEFPSVEHKCQFVLPKLISWANFCGPITLDEAIDIETGHFNDD